MASLRIMKHTLYNNPWHDCNNELSPIQFEVKGQPIAFCNDIDFYEVTSRYQTPSVLAVKGETVLTQCVTVNGCKRAILANHRGSNPSDTDIRHFGSDRDLA